MSGQGLLGTAGIAAAVCLLAIPAVSGCRSEGPRKLRLSIATGGTGGVFYPYGGGIAKVITAHVPNVEATAEVTAASVDNLKFLRDHKADLAFTTADTLADAVNGTDVLQRHETAASRTRRALCQLHAGGDAGIESDQELADLKGKVVSTGHLAAGAS